MSKWYLLQKILKQYSRIIIAIVNITKRVKNKDNIFMLSKVNDSSNQESSHSSLVSFGDIKYLGSFNLYKFSIQTYRINSNNKLLISIYMICKIPCNKLNWCQVFLNVTWNWLPLCLLKLTTSLSIDQIHYINFQLDASSHII